MIFGAWDVELCLPRAGVVIASLESAVGSAIGLMSRIGAGLWRVEDVRLVLCHAWPDVTPLGPLTAVHEVDEVLRRRAPGPYAVLAHKLLQACLVGLDGEAARWSEERPA